MKNSELRRLVSEYKVIKLKNTKNPKQNSIEKLKEIEHRYFHETGRTLKSDLEK